MDIELIEIWPVMTWFLGLAIGLIVADIKNGKG